MLSLFERKGIVVELSGVERLFAACAQNNGSAVQEIVMHDQPFKFGEQGSYGLDPPVMITAGDTVTTTCTFDNDTSRNITFGESTENEMCFNFASYYPKGALICGLGGLGN